MSEGVGTALCPTGTSPIGGGIVPDPTGATDDVYIVASTANTSGTTFNGWFGVASDANHSYAGAGFVFVSCTSAPTVLSTSAKVAARAESAARVAAHARWQQR
jgi:hypothetical protein